MSCPLVCCCVWIATCDSKGLPSGRPRSRGLESRLSDSCDSCDLQVQVATLPAYLPLPLHLPLPHLFYHLPLCYFPTLNLFCRTSPGFCCSHFHSSALLSHHKSHHHPSIVHNGAHQTNTNQNGPAQLASRLSRLTRLSFHGRFRLRLRRGPDPSSRWR